MAAMTSSLSQQFERAAALIDDADALIVAAGAGMGIDSGLPDFRGNEGFWTAYPALREARLDFRRSPRPPRFAMRRRARGVSTATG